MSQCKFLIENNLSKQFPQMMEYAKELFLCQFNSSIYSQLIIYPNIYTALYHLQNDFTLTHLLSLFKLTKLLGKIGGNYNSNLRVAEEIQ